ncbi:serine threonine- kinase VRK1-like isoform X1 [Labeo rohita]|uniref:Serine threonine-kinase VRK1-like isoform X1 n=1 Tax=Labeo rohita TaxID=84645 RepID=A0A498N3V5_LABRO|nr:serine threonine- kinase VRK1-like isoform X1 [Labeo rohita]
MVQIALHRCLSRATCSPEFLSPTFNLSASVSKWKKLKQLEFLGIPTYWGSGLAENNGTRYRFMVMDRLGTDMQKVLVENGGQLKKPTVLQLGVLMVYLADYGLSYRYCPNGEHKEYKENPKKGHNGTIEYTSIDAHKGVAPSRRGDLEVLGYCLLHWQCGTLPWLSSLKNPAEVQEAKAKLMSNLPDSVLKMSTSSTEIARYLSSVKTLGYNDKPDYQALRKILSGAGPQGPLDLSTPRPSETARPTTQRAASQPKTTEKKTARSKPVVTAEEEDEEELGRSTPKKVWSRTKQETPKQSPNKTDMAAKRSVRQRPVPYESDEDISDEDEPLPPRVHPKTRAGARQKQELQQEKRNEDVYEGKTLMTMRGRQNRHYKNQQTRTLTLNDDHPVLGSEVDYWGNYSRKQRWNQNHWENTNDGDHWRSDVRRQEDERTRYHYRDEDGFGKSENQGQWPVKRMLIFLVVIILTVVGCWYYPRWRRNAT